MVDGEETPPYYLCPISLQIMSDPVTLSTGVTYDRRSIERWFSTYSRTTCPVTNQPLDDQTLTPNSTLLRLIRSWSASKTPCKDQINRSVVDVSAVVDDVIRELKLPLLQIKSLRKIKCLIQESPDDEIRVCMEESGVTSLVASLASESRDHETSSLPSSSAVIDEATSLLRLLNPTPMTLKKLVELKDGELVGSLSSTMQKGCYKARIDATTLLKFTFRVIDDKYKAVPPEDLFDGLIDVLKDQNSDRDTTLAALSILLEVVPHGKNREKAVESGAVALLVELLMEERNDRRKCEAMLALLATFCMKAEGRAPLLDHPAGVAAVARKMLKVSHTATEMAVKVLLLLCKYCGGRLAEEMIVVGAVANLCTVMQVECSRKARDMARDIIGLHLKAWNKHPCFPVSLHRS